MASNVKTVLLYLILFYENVSATCLAVNGSIAGVTGNRGITSGMQIRLTCHLKWTIYISNKLGPIHCPNYPLNERCLFIPGLFSTTAPPNYVFLTYNTSSMYNLTFTFDYTVDRDYVSIAYTNIYYNCSAGYSLGYKISAANGNSLSMPIYKEFGFDLPEMCDNKLEIIIAFEHYANTDINFDEACVIMMKLMQLVILDHHL